MSVTMVKSRFFGVPVHFPGYPLLVEIDKIFSPSVSDSLVLVTTAAQFAITSTRLYINTTRSPPHPTFSTTHTEVTTPPPTITYDQHTARTLVTTLVLRALLKLSLKLQKKANSVPKLNPTVPQLF